MRFSRDDLGGRDYRLGRRQAGQNLLGLRQERRDILCDDNARHRCLRPSLGSCVIADDVPSGGHEVARDRASHDPEADAPHASPPRVPPSGDPLHRSLASDH